MYSYPLCEALNKWAEDTLYKRLITMTFYHGHVYAR